MTVLPANDPLVRKALKDFRVEKNRIAKIRGTGKFKSAVFPELSGQEVLLEYIDEKTWLRNRPKFASRWWNALRVPYLLFSWLPLLLALFIQHEEGGVLLSWQIFPLFLSVTLLQLGCHLWGDYEDHLRGIDSPENEGGSGVIQKLWIPAVHMRNAAALFFTSGLIIGLFLLHELPIHTQKQILYIGVGSAIGMASFSGWPFHYKYFGLGEPIMFLLSGPIATIGAALVFSHESAKPHSLAAISLPLSFLATLRLHTGNLQRIPFDAMAGSRTIARYLGFKGSCIAYAFLLFAPFLTVSLLYFLKLVQTQNLICLALLPLLAPPLREAQKISGPMDPKCLSLRKHAARLHLLFGLLYCLSFSSCHWCPHTFK